MKPLVIIILLQTFLFSNNSLFAQWAPTRGPEKGDITCLAVDGNKIYAVTIDGIYLSSTSGDNWEFIGLPGKYISCIAFGDNAIYVGTTFNGFYYTTNSGNNWIQNNNGLTYNHINSIAEMDGYIYAGTDNGLFAEYGYGGGWSKIVDQIEGYSVEFKSLFVKDDHMFAGTNIGILLSPGYYSGWVHADNGISNAFDAYPIVNMTLIGSYLFAGSGLGLYRSSDNGSNWVHVYNGLTSSSINSLSNDGINVYAGTDYGIYISTDFGSDWSQKFNGNMVSSVITLQSYVFVGTHEGIFFSTDYGSNWNKTGLPITSNYFLLNKESDIYSATDIGIALSTNNGNNWTYLGPENIVSSFIIGTGVSNLIFAATSYGISLTTDGGLTWNTSNLGLGTDYNIYSLAQSGNNIFAGSSNGNIYINNYGTWTKVKSDQSGSIIQTLAVNGSYVFAGTWGDGVYCSSNNGVDWTQANSGLDNKYVHSFAFIGSNIFAATYSGVFLSTNNGANWKNVGLNSLDIMSLANSGNTLFASEWFYQSIYFSTDMGTSWTPSDAIGSNVYSILVNSGYIFAGSEGAGVWRYPLSAFMGVSNDVNNIPKEYSLSQNYPNPFNPSTTINYSVPKAGNIKLTVYNTLGANVAVIVNGYKPAGNYSVRFNAANLASGIYFYKLESGSFSQAKKFILMK